MSDRVAAQPVVRQAGTDAEQVACVLCGSEQATPTMTARNFDSPEQAGVSYQVVQCRGCGLQFLNPRPSPAQLASFYPEHYYAYVETEPKPIGRFKAFWEWLGRWSKLSLRRAFWQYPAPSGRVTLWALRLVLWPLWLRMVVLGKDLKVVPYRGQGRLLEVGCGKGAWLDYQRQYGFAVTGVEMSRSPVDVAHRRYKLDVRRGTLEDAKFPDRSFDLIYMSHVFEHLPNPAATLEEMHRILDTCGLAILKVPNIASASARRFGACWLGLDLPRHLYHFSPETITALLRRHGFAVSAIRQDLGAWGFWRESRRLQALESHRRLAPSWWRNHADQIMEALACRRGQGSNIVVYARKADGPAHPSP
ncbi:MAG: class I SAM-dependent methyltransferase [Candidatus Omnitrophica bacterium]|nr:class I SAM-dependent methyltransferase [Candidatus Omnitrophota bacterium]